MDFQIIRVVGNGDFETQKIQTCVSDEGYTGSVSEGAINGLTVALTNVYITKTFNQLLTNSPAQYIFHRNTPQKEKQQSMENKSSILVPLIEPAAATLAPLAFSTHKLTDWNSSNLIRYYQ